MASSDSQIDKPQRRRPKRAELPDVNINTGAQSINTERASLIRRFRSLWSRGSHPFRAQSGGLYVWVSDWLSVCLVQLRSRRQTTTRVRTEREKGHHASWPDEQTWVRLLRHRGKCKFTGSDIFGKFTRETFYNMFIVRFSSMGRDLSAVWFRTLTNQWNCED